MSYHSFTVTIENHIGHICLSRGDTLNTLTQAFWRELPHCLEQLDSNGDVRVVVVSSTGKHFSAGMDLKVFHDPAALSLDGEAGRMAENLRRLVLRLQGVVSSLENVRMPVLTTIQGGCIGGALDLVCASDSRYCTADAFFTIKETQLGMTADLGTLQRLPSLIGQGLARELAYTGRKLTADQALQCGLVNQVFADHQEMLGAVMAIAQQIAANSPLAVTGCKQMLNYSRDHSVSDSLSYMATWQAGMFRMTDMQQALTAQQQRQPPVYEPLKSTDIAFFSEPK